MDEEVPPTDASSSSHWRAAYEFVDIAEAEDHSSSNSQSNQKNESERDSGEERDTFSPIEPPLESPVDFYPHEVDNKASDKRRNKPASSSKEEKQRQNEEIVILETSSVSSETGSWESIFPQKVAEAPVAATGGEPSGACFIDASSLLDDAEVDFVKPDIEPQKASSSSSVCSNEASQKDEHNLSDEEKLLHIKDAKKVVDINDQFKEPSPDDFSLQLFRSDSGQGVSKQPSTEGDEGQVKLRRDNERKQGRLVFDNNIQQFSGHLISPKMSFPEYFEPNTPHNSIAHVDFPIRSSSGSCQRDSGAYCSDSTDSPVASLSSKRSKCDESSPIVSGGVSVKDFTPKQCESPPVKRRTDACPIISGGLMSSDFHTEEEAEERQQASARKPQPKQCWVVDMSDCKQERRPSNPLERTSSGTYSKNSLGFYVSLNNMDSAASLPADVNAAPQKSVKKPTGFYVDLSESENSPSATPPPSARLQTPPINGNGSLSDSKKNIFSMFIDFGEKKTSKREPFSLASRLSSSLTQKRRESSSSTETLMSSSTNEKLDSAGETALVSSDESRKPSLQYTADTKPVLRRLPKEDKSKRHSWNSNASDSSSHCDPKRSTSLTGDNDLMNIIDKIPLLSKTSNLSIDSSMSAFDKSTNSTSTSVSGGEAEVVVSSGKLKNKKRRKDVEINETFDKSSPGSMTDGVFSHRDNLSSTSTTDTDDVTFQLDEHLCEELASQGGAALEKDILRPSVMETIIETKEVFSPRKTNTHTMETLQATIEKQKQLLETVNEHAEANNSSSSFFVKLSDMDKPLTTFELHSPDTMMSHSVGNHRNINRLFGDSRVRPHSWAMTRSTGNSILNITNSVDNLRSLTRLFPHLSREFSNSLPTGMSLERFANDLDCIQSDISTESSLASSFSRSGMDESSISCRQPRRLGEDLLKMFLQELATDVVIEVNGRRIKAHKCILRSRCQYFAAILAGGWVQSAGNVISLAGYSYCAVHFALCHIYSGASHPPDGISLMELSALADLLGLEGLKEVTAHALKVNYCHNFHKPCSGCIDGILQVLPVALNHALDDLYRKCLKWTCRHYMKVWPTRSFAQLPNDILGRCRQQVVAHLTSENVLETIIDCDQLVSQLAPCRWATVTENLVRDILDAAYMYVSDHFASLIASDSFLSLGHDRSVYVTRLESILLHTAASLTPDQACRSYQRVTRLNTVLATRIIKMPHIGDLNKEFQQVQEEDLEWNADFIRLVSSIMSAVEQCLTRQCSKAMRINSWQRLDLDLRKKIQTLARLTEPLELRRGKPVTKAFSFGGSSRNQDLYQVKLAIQAHSKRALAQDTQLFRAPAPKQSNAQDKNVQTVENHSEGKILKTNSKAHVPQSAAKTFGCVANRRTQSVDSSQKTSSSQENNRTTKGSRLAEIKPRYLEPRKLTAVQTGPLKSHTSSNILTTKKGKHISSSESSRTSSPAGRNRKSVNMSLDSLASPSKKATKVKEKPSSSENVISVDSLGSMKSSVRTEKTISQESLYSKGKLSIQCNKVTNKFLSKNKSRQSTNSAGSSPSTTTTNKSSSRISSATASPRDAFKHRSISVPMGKDTKVSGQPTPTTVRKSFLSAKSREILARRAEKETHESTRNAINKSYSVSNIPMRRTMPPTTLNLRKTVRVTVAPSQGQNKLAKADRNTEKKKTMTDVASMKKHKVENDIHIIDCPPEDGAIDSKLERSSTFCKESSDLSFGELQPID